MSKFRDTNFAVPLVQHLGFSYTRKVPDLAIGLEIETVYKGDVAPFLVTTKHWTIHDDRSVRPGPGEFSHEFVFNGPKWGKTLTEAMNEFQELKKSLKFRDTHQASVHVHVSVRQLPAIQMFNLLTLNAILENNLFELFCGESRQGNLFCLRMCDAEYMVETYRHAAAKGSFKLAIVDESSGKYSALNLCPIPRFGTIEFRGLEGTTDVDRILNWVNIVRDVVQASGYFTDPQDIIQSFSGLGHAGLLQKAFPENPDLCQRILSLGQHGDQNAWDGMRLAQEIAYARSSWPVNFDEIV